MASEPIVVSSTDLQRYMRCKKLFQFAYIMRRDPKELPERMVEGSSIHAELAEAANGRTAALGPVVQTYLATNALPEKILHIEEPLFVPVMPGATLRFTPDLVYEQGQWIVCRDYKTFDKKPTFDQDLDFQSQLYLAGLRLLFPGRKVRWEHVFIRNVPPGTPNSKGVWTERECYITIPIVLSADQLDAAWQDLVDVMQEIVGRLEKQGPWYREPQKGFGGCSSCLLRDLCKSERLNGHLDSATIDLLSVPRGER